jgi:hypothetical protein
MHAEYYVSTTYRYRTLTGWHDTSAHVCRGDRIIGRLPKFVVARWWGTGHKVHLTTCASGSEAMTSAAVERRRDSRDLFDNSGDTAVAIIPPLEKSSIPPAQLLHEWWCVFCP